MRGALWVVLLLIAIAPAAAKELNTTTFVAQDSFRLDGITYDILNTFVEKAHLQWQGQGRILEEDDCELTAYHKFCLKTSTNNSADITFHSRDFNLTLERSAPEDVEVGEEFEVTLYLQNKAEKDLPITLTESSPLAIIDRTGFDERMRWKGTLRPGQGQTLKYTARALRAGDIVLTATVDAAYPTDDTHEIEVDDYVDIEFDYVNRTTEDAAYNWSVELTEVDAETEADITVIIPGFVTIVKDGQFRQNNDILVWDENLNESRTPWFTYKTTMDGNATMNVTVTTERNDSRVNRRYELPVQQSGFGQLIIIHDHQGRQLIAGEETNLPVQIHNPNDRTVTADLTITSVLLTKEQTLTIAANQTQTLDLAVTANTSTSKYNLVIDLLYEDDNGAEIAQKETIKLEGASKPQAVIPETTPTLSARWEGHEENATLTITAQDINGTGTLNVFVDGNMIVNRTQEVVSGQPIIVTQEGYGTYDVQLHIGQTLLERSATLSEPKAQVVAEPEQASEEKNSFPTIAAAIIALAIITIAAGAYMLAAPKLRKRRLDTLYARSLRLQQEIAQETGFLNTFYPASNEDLTMKNKMASDLAEKQRELQGMMGEIERLRGQTIKTPQRGRPSRGVR